MGAGTKRNLTVTEIVVPAAFAGAAAFTLSPGTKRALLAV